VSSAAQVAQSSERSGPQGREARSGAADAEVFAHVSSAHAARPPARAGALLPNLRWPEGAALSLLTALFAEGEPYRVWDVAASEWHTMQTAGVRLGHLVLVAQGHGCVSLVIVGGGVGDGARAAGDAALEITILVRATAAPH